MSMKKIKQLISILLILCLMTALFPASAIVSSDVPETAPEEIIELPKDDAEKELLVSPGKNTATTAATYNWGDNHSWSLSSDGVLTISGSGPMPYISNDESQPWYSSRSRITRVVIDRGITTLTRWAFTHCTSLTSISFPDTLTSIEDYGFHNCPALTTLAIPESVTSIASSAFSGFSGLRSITLPSGLTEISDRMFSSCRNLRSITIPSSVTTIGSQAFWNCGSLFSIVIPKSVTSIEDEAFYNCSKLRDVYYPGTEEEWNAISIGTQNSALTYSNLIFGESAPTIASPTLSVSNNTDTGKPVLVWNAVEGAEQYEVYTSSSENGVFSLLWTGTDTEWTHASAVVNASYYYKVRAIAESARGEFSEVKHLVCNYAGSGNCSDTITWKLSGDGVLTLTGSGEMPAYETQSTTNNYYQTVTTSTAPWGSYCAQITDIVVNRGITSIGSCSFFGCTNLTSVNLPRSLTVIHPQAFYDCSSLASITLPNSLTEIGEAAFQSCTALTEIAIPDGVTVLGEKAFADCSALASATLPEGLTCVGAEAFVRCARLASVTLPTTLTTIDDSAFANCTALTSIVIPHNVTEINSGAFQNCTGLAAVTIPKDIAFIRANAFYNCPNLMDVYYFGSEDEWDSISIDPTNGDLIYADITFNVTMTTLAAPELSVNVDSATGKPSLSWDEVYGAATYAVYRSSEENGDFDQLWSGTETSLTDSSAQPGSTYYYKVRALAGGTESAFSAVISCACALPAPVVTVSVNRNGKPVISWSSVSGAAKYEIYRSTVENGTYSRLSSTTGTKITNTSAELGVTYYYKVRAVNDTLYSLFSEAVSRTCICAQPELTLSWSDSGKPVLTWTAVDGATGYTVYYAYQEDGTYYPMSAADTTMTHSSASAGITYYYKVCALNGTTEGVASEIQSIVCGASDSGTCGDGVYWEIAPNGTLTITGNGAMQFESANTDWRTDWRQYRYLVQTLIVDKGVTSICDGAFAAFTVLTSVTMADTVTSLGKKAFSQCFALSSVRFSENLTIIGDSCFVECKTLAAVTIPDNVTEIGAMAFSDCSALVSVSLPDGIDLVGNGVFARCSSLTTVELPAALTKVSPEMFIDCTSLTQITIPDNVFAIGSGAFSGCSALTSISLPRILSTVEDEAFHSCYSLADVFYAGKESEWDAITFGANNGTLTTARITFGADDSTISIPALTITNSETSGKPVLRWNAVQGATRYEIYRSTDEAGPYTLLWSGTGTKINNTSAKPGVIYYYKIRALAGETCGMFSAPISRLCLCARPVLTVKHNVNRGQPVLTWDAVEGAESYRIDYSYYDGGTLYEYSNTTTETIYYFSFLTVGKRYSFKVCAITGGECGAFSEAQSIIVNSSGSGSCGDNATWKVSGDGILTIGGTGEVTSRPWSELSRQITTVVINNGITNIPDNAFHNHANLTSITIPDSVTTIGDYAFHKCKSLTEITIPEKLTGIGKEAFYSCESLTSISIPNSVTTIGAGAFSVCSALTSITLPSGLTELSSAVLNSCVSLTAITIPDSVTKIGAGALRNCTKLTKIVLPTGVTEIGENAFALCSGLTTISIPRATETMGINAFFNCSAIQTVYYGGTASEWEALLLRNTATALACTNIVCSASDLILAIPTLTVSNNASTGKVVLQWTAVKDAEKYEVWRATSKTGEYTLLKTMTGTKLTNTSAEVNKTYYYKVRAVAGDVTGEFSPVKSRTCDLARPVVTVTLNAKNNPVLTWKAVSGAEKYEVYRSTSQNGTYTRLWTGTGTKLTNSSAELGVTYYYKVRAISSVSSATSAYSTVKSIASEEVVSLPMPMVALSYTDSGKPVLTWGTVDGATSYQIWYCDSLTGEYQLLTSLTDCTFTHTDTVSGETYYYKIRAVSGAEVSNFSPILSITLS